MKGRIRVITAGGTIDKDYTAGADNHSYNFEIEGNWCQVPFKLMGALFFADNPLD